MGSEEISDNIGKQSWVTKEYTHGEVIGPNPAELKDKTITIQGRFADFKHRLMKHTKAGDYIRDIVMSEWTLEFIERLINKRFPVSIRSDSRRDLLNCVATARFMG